VLTGRSLIWSSNRTGVATVDANGNVHAVAPGSATITAATEGKNGTATIVVILAPVASVTVAPPLDTIFVDSMVQLTATLKDARGNVLTDRQVDWSTSDNNVASVDRRTGVVRARNPGTAQITATSENQTGSATIVVQVVPVASVEIDPPSPVGSPTVSLAFNQSQTFTAQLFDVFHNELSGRTVSWRVENQGNQAAVSSCTVRDNSCTVTATLVTGSAWVIASFMQSTQLIEDTAEVTATGLGGSPTSSIEVKPKDPKIKIGQSVQLSAKVMDSDHHPIDTATVIWSSSNGEIASVNSGGVVTGLARGQSKVVARALGASGATMVRVQ
jgi:uncharacterized protein YjdB